MTPNAPRDARPRTCRERRVDAGRDRWRRARCSARAPLASSAQSACRCPRIHGSERLHRGPVTPSPHTQDTGDRGSSAARGSRCRAPAAHRAQLPTLRPKLAGAAGSPLAVAPGRHYRPARASDSERLWDAPTALQRHSGTRARSVRRPALLPLAIRAREECGRSGSPNRQSCWLSSTLQGVARSGSSVPSPSRDRAYRHRSRHRGRSRPPVVGWRCCMVRRTSSSLRSASHWATPRHAQ